MKQFPEINTRELVGRRASARVTQDEGRRFCAIRWQRGDTAIVQRCCWVKSETRMYVVGLIEQMSAGGGYEWGHYWTALDGTQSGPFHGIRAALEDFVKWQTRRTRP